MDRQNTTKWEIELFMLTDNNLSGLYSKEIVKFGL